MKDRALTCKITSILLQYPDEQVRVALPDITAALPAVSNIRHRASLAGFVHWLHATNPTDAARHYVDTFDHTRRRSLYMTYYRHGDTRTRGAALLALNDTYRQAGYPPPTRELPDYLPLMLEFAALAPETGHRVLLQHQAELELLRRALHELASPYGALVDVASAGLPRLRKRQRTDLDTLAACGPPTERVGLEPHAAYGTREWS